MLGTERLDLLRGTKSTHVAEDDTTYTLTELDDLIAEYIDAIRLVNLIDAQKVSFSLTEMMRSPAKFVDLFYLWEYERQNVEK